MIRASLVGETALCCDRHAEREAHRRAQEERVGQAAAVVLAAPTIEDLPALRELTEALMPMTSVLLGGAHQDEVVGPELLGHRAGAAAAALAERLATASPDV